LIRTSKELYTFFADLKDASQSVRLLLIELEQLGSILASIQQYANDHESSSFAVHDGLAIPEVTGTLEACRGEFERLQTFAKAANVLPEDGKVKRMAKKLKWVFNDAKLSNSRENLERLKSSLTLALSAVGRFVAL
jgi:hypothetical protein